MRAMILAAGRGERMRPFTDHTPKPLLQVARKALIDYHLEALYRAGVRDVVINLAWLGSQIQVQVGDGARYGLRIRYSDEGSVALETGGGILKALALLGADPFWLVNSDIYCEYDFPVPTLAPGMLAHLVLVPNPPHNAGGDFVLRDGQVGSAGDNRLTFSGVSLLHPELLAGQTPGKFPLAPLLYAAAARGQVSGELFRGRWTDVGTPQRLQALEAQLAAR